MHVPTQTLPILLFLTILSLPPSFATITGTRTDLVSTTGPSFSPEASSWTVTNAIQPTHHTQCGTTFLLGGYNVFGGNTAIFEKTYSGLPGHASVQVLITFWFIDTWTSSSSIEFKIIDGAATVITKTIQVQNDASWPSDLCGNSPKDLPGVVASGAITHYNPSVTLRVQCNSGTCGFRDVKIILSSDPLGADTYCTYADNPTFLAQDRCTCATASDTCFCGFGNYFDTSTAQCGPCDGSCATCSGPGDHDCRSCDPGYSLGAGSACIQCATGCSACTGTLASDCTQCEAGKYMYQNSSCRTGCSSPYSTQTVGLLNYCNSPCPSTQYIYSTDTSCNNDCNSPFTARIEGLEKFCDAPCQNGYYLYPDGSCSPRCISPMKFKETYGLKQCLSPCSDSSMFYYPEENTCKYACDDPFVSSKADFYKICTSSTEKGTLEVIKEATDGVLNIGLIISSVASLGDSFSIIDGTMSRMFQYIRYLNISYSPELQKVLVTWSNSLFSLKINASAPSSLQDESMYKPLPQVFSKYGLYPSFLANFWSEWLMICGAFVIFLCFVALQYIVTRTCEHRKLLCFLIRKLRVISQQFVLMISYTCYGDILFYSILEYRSTLSGQNLSNASLIISILQVAVGLGVLALQINLVITKQRILANQTTTEIKSQALKQFYTNHEGCQVFFHDFKDKTLGQQGFLLFFISRTLILILVLATLFEYPLAQAIIIVVLNVIMMVFLILKRPFKDLINEVQQITSELALLIVNIGVLVMAVLDARGFEATDSRENIGMMIIMLTIIFNFASLVFLALMALEAARNFYKQRKLKKLKGPTPSPIPIPNSSQSNLSQTQTQIDVTGNQNSSISNTTWDLDSSRKLTINPKRLKLKHAETMGKIKEENNRNLEQRFQTLDSKPIQDAHVQRAAAILRRGNSEIKIYTESNKDIARKANQVEGIKKTKENLHQPHIDLSFSARESERSLMDNRRESLATETERSPSPELRRNHVISDQPVTNVRTKIVETPLRITSIVPTLQQPDKLARTMPNARVEKEEIVEKEKEKEKGRVHVPYVKQSSMNSLRDTVRSEPRGVKEVSEGPVMMMKGPIVGSNNAQAVSFAAELAKKINTKHQENFVKSGKQKEGSVMTDQNETREL